MRGVRVKCQVWKGRGWPPWSLHTHTLQRGREGTLCWIFCLILSPQLLLFSLSLSATLHSFTLSIFHPLLPNYWCHCKLNCCNRIAAFPLNSLDRYLLQWKWRLFPSANFQVCVMAGTEENAGWLPPLLWNVFHQRLRDALKFRLSPLYFKHSPLLSLSVSSLRALLTPLSIYFRLSLPLWVKILL